VKSLLRIVSQDPGPVTGFEDHAIRAMLNSASNSRFSGADGATRSRCNCPPFGQNDVGATVGPQRFDRLHQPSKLQQNRPGTCRLRIPET